ncbi:MAG: hypothetical protein H7Z12_20225, partial [Rhodospirillaceae bacterium]|nr:hypothetical protein [Rhodospirillales bacterium]
VYAQRYAADGSTVGGEFRVNSHAPGNQGDPSIIGLANGNFAVAWLSNGQATYNVNNIYYKVFSSSGAELTGDLPVSGPSYATTPSIAALTEGGFAVTWLSGGEIYGQILNDDGSKRTANFLVNSYTNNTQSLPSVTGTADGGFVVSWQSYGEDLPGTSGIYAQRFTANGALVGGEFPINVTTAGDQSNVAIAARSDGGFVAAWDSPQDAGGLAVESRVYNSGSTALNVYGGTSGADTLFGNSGSDTLIGGSGADTYLAGNGSGADLIDNHGHTADGDKMVFGTGIGMDQLWFQQAADDLKVSVIGTNDSLTISGWFASNANHVATLQTADGHTLADTSVQNLVSAMAAMAPPTAGQTVLTDEQHEQLDAVIAANWQSH